MTAFRKSPRIESPKKHAFFTAQSWHMPCSFEGLEYSERYRIMKLTRTLFVVVSVVVSASPAFADARGDAKSQVDFGISVAQRGLWREAIYRWEKAVEIDPTYAAAFNDLAIAYEHEGQLDKARKAYEKALELDPNNSQIRQNYELFKEINDRTSSGKEK